MVLQDTVKIPLMNAGMSSYFGEFIDFEDHFSFFKVLFEVRSFFKVLFEVRSFHINLLRDF